MKICYLAPANSIHTIRLVNYFAKKGYETHLISFTKPLPGLDSSVFFHSVNHQNDSSADVNNTAHSKISIHQLLIPLKKIKDRAPFLSNLAIIKEYPKISHLIKKIDPDIIHAHYITSYGLLGILTRVHPIYLSVWGSDLWFESRGLMRPISGFILKNADGIHCDGENVYCELEKFDKTPDKINIIQFGTDIERFKPDQGDKNLKPSLGTPGCIAIVSLRSLEPIYDIASLIHAVPTVLLKHPDTHFFIAGKGSEEQNLKELTISLQIEKNVHFIGSIPNEKLPVFLNESDIYVSTSLSDGGLAASTAEAMACELPVIVTDFGDNSKWISHEHNGYLIPLKCPEKLAERINFLIENPDKRQFTGKNARDAIVRKNNYFVEMDKIDTIYNNLVKRYHS